MTLLWHKYQFQIQVPVSVEIQSQCFVISFIYFLLHTVIYINVFFKNLTLKLQTLKSTFSVWTFFLQVSFKMFSSISMTLHHLHALTLCPADVGYTNNESKKKSVLQQNYNLPLLSSQHLLRNKYKLPKFAVHVNVSHHLQAFTFMVFQKQIKEEASRLFPIQITLFTTNTV